MRVGVIFDVFSGQVWAFLIFGGGVRGRWPKIFRGVFITFYRVEGFGESTEAFLGLWDPPKCEKSQKIEFFFFDFFDIFSDFSTDFLTLASTRVGSPMPIHLGPGAQPHYVNTLDI